MIIYKHIDDFLHWWISGLLYLLPEDLREKIRHTPDRLLLELDEETQLPRLAKELLPKVLISDPVVQAVKETAEVEDMARLAADADHTPLPAGWIADRVIKVIRRSPSAGKSIAYRLIVEGN